MIPPQAAIVGTGRSGSAYISAVFQAAGVNVGIEKWWRPNGPLESGLVADSSWLASRHLEGFEGVVLHQVRHPLHVISSLADGALFGPDANNTEHRQIRTSVFEVSGDNLLDSMRCYMAWLRLAEAKADGWWRVEDINPELIQEISHVHFGIDIADETAIEAVASVGTNYHGQGLHEVLTLQDLPDPAERPVTARVMEVMAEYGYNADGTVENAKAWGTPADLDLDADDEGPTFTAEGKD